MSPAGINASETAVLIDALSARVGGGVTDLVNLIPALNGEYPQLQATVVLSSRYQTELIARMDRGIAVYLVDVPPMPSLKRLLFLESELPRIVERTEAKVLLCLGELIPRATGCPVVALVRNSNFFARWGSLGSLRNDIHGSLNRMVAQPLIRRLVTRADHLVFVSEAFRDDVCEFYPSVLKKSSVAHLGVDPTFSKEPEDVAHPPPEGRYILSVGGIASHKNHETLIKAFAKLVMGSGFQDLTLVIVGTLMQRGAHERLVALSRDIGVEKRVVFTNLLPHQSLPAFYRASLLHVLPSKLETFGHPYVEAMICGTPVLASDIPVAHEICGDAAEFFSPTDAAELERLMRAIIDDARRRSKLIEKGHRRAAEFSWARTAGAVGSQLLRASVGACD